MLQVPEIKKKFIALNSILTGININHKINEPTIRRYLVNSEIVHALRSLKDYAKKSGTQVTLTVPNRPIEHIQFD